MSGETRHPSSEDMEKAAGMMSEEQKKLSEAREEGYRLAESKFKEKEPAPQDPEAPTIVEHGKTKGGKSRSYEVLPPEKPYYEKTTVNGIRISVGWDNSYADYTIYFPDVTADAAAADRGVYDQVMRITRKPEVAKKVFAYAAEMAKIEPDVIELFKKVEKFSKEQDYGY